MLRRDQKMIERAEVALNLARKEYFPDFRLNGGYYNMGGMPEMYMFEAEIRIPLYFFRKQRAGVTEQAQSVVRSRRMYEATNQSLHFRIQDDYLMAQTAEQLSRLYRETVIPQASLALEASLASYETGSVDFLTVLTNFITVVEYEMNYYGGLQDLYVALSKTSVVRGRSSSRSQLTSGRRHITAVCVASTFNLSSAWTRSGINSFGNGSIGRRDSSS